MKDSKLPGWSTWLLKVLCPDDHLEWIVGDILEQYQYRKKSWLKNIYLVRDILSTVKMIKHNKTQNNHSFMFHNHFKAFWRRLIKSPVSSTVNVFGLALGIAFSVIVIQFLIFENERLGLE